MGAAPFLVLAVFMVLGVASIMAWKRKATRPKELARMAEAAGLSFSEGDPFNCTRVPFRTFQLGDGRGAENVMWGRAPDGVPVAAFDLWYYVEYDDGTRRSPGPFGLGVGAKEQVGQPTRRYRRLNCALTEVPAVWPHLVIEPERGLTKLLGPLDVIDIEFESGEFNRMFRVTCEDKRFAQTFIDAQMINFLIDTKGECTFEVRGRWVLLTTPEVPAQLVPGMIQLSNAFRSKIPPVIWDLYTRLEPEGRAS